jgi:hypothetical protein
MKTSQHLSRAPIEHLKLQRVQDHRRGPGCNMWVAARLPPPAHRRAEGRRVQFAGYKRYLGRCRVPASPVIWALGPSVPLEL